MSRIVPLVLDEIEYRSKLSSEEMNEKIVAIRDAITTSVMNAQRLNALVHLYKLSEHYGSSQKFSDNQLLLSLTNQYLNSPAFPANVIFFSSRDSGKIIANTAITADEYTGVSYLTPTTLLSKITTVVDELGDRVVHPDTTLTVNGVQLPIKHLAYRMLNLEETDVWIDDSSLLASTTVTITHPQSVKDTLNYIRIYPFPENGPAITNVEYLGSNGSYTTIPWFGSFSAPTEFHFSPVSYANSLRLTITNKLYLNRRVWGFRSVELYNATYSSVGEILFEGTTLDGANISNITSFTADYENANQVVVGSVMDQPIYFLLESPTGVIYYDSRTGVSPFTTTSPVISYSAANTNKLRLRVVFRSQGGTSPVFRSASITYT